MQSTQTRTCTIDGCVKPVFARGWCQMHYRRWAVHGDTSVVHPQAIRSCTFDGCDRSHEAQGLCHGHRAQTKRGGELRPLRRQVRGTSEERFETYIDRTGECWEWTGGVSDNGYGQMKHNGATVSAHRYAYERQNGPIPVDLQIDHLCRNRRCANPDHLEAVTQEENLRRSRACGKTYNETEGDAS